MTTRCAQLLTVGLFHCSVLVAGCSTAPAVSDAPSGGDEVTTPAPEGDLPPVATDSWVDPGHEGVLGADDDDSGGGPDDDDDDLVDYEICGDGEDNEGDGFVDSADDECWPPGPSPLANVCPATPSGTPFVDVTDCVGLLAGHWVGHLPLSPDHPTPPPADVTLVPPEEQHWSTGNAWADFDGDGFVDLSTSGGQMADTIYRGLPDGTFEAWAPPGFEPLFETTTGGRTAADVDGDGWVDLYVSVLGENRLFLNQGGTNFVEVAAAAGADDPGNGSNSAWADFDLDGDLDAYVVNYSCWSCPLDHAGRDALLVNQGDGTFVNETGWLPEESTRGFGFVPAWTDLDLDGDLDLFVVNDLGTWEEEPEWGYTNRMAVFRNDGPGCGGWCFEDVAIDWGLEMRINGMGLAVGMPDGGSQWWFGISDTGPTALMSPYEPEMWFDGALAAGLDTPRTGWGIAFLDFDNDGDEDLYMAAGAKPQAPDESNVLWENLGGAMFLDVSQGSGADYVGWGVGLSVADWDRDGWVDLLVGEADEGYRLFRNMGGSHPATAGNHWLEIRLAPDGDFASEAFGAAVVGARVEITDDSGRTQTRELRLGEAHGGNFDPTLHFGLGSALPTGGAVHWPDGEVQVLPSLEPDQVYVVLRPQVTASTGPEGP